MKKTYKLESVTYGFGSGKWLFQARNGKIQFLTIFRGGAPVAHKVARQIAGSVKRNPKSIELDNLARTQIAAIAHM